MAAQGFKTRSPFGILNVNKPADWTSRDVVNRVAKRFKKTKVGHAGTLDPLATGVLVVCVGPATRLIEYVQSREKEYQSTFVLGKTSDTDDSTGTILSESDASYVTTAQIDSALKQFQGRIMQVPPQYSAVHVKGERAYQRVRQGEQVDLEPREVEVHQIEIVAFSACELKLRIVCGSGTYIRSIARDLGEQLSCGALLSQLVRTRIGPFRLEHAISVEEVLSEDLETKLLSPDKAVAHLQRLTLEEQQLTALLHGRTFSVDQEFSVTGDVLQLRTREGELAGIGKISDDRVQPKLVFLQHKQTP